VKSPNCRHFVSDVWTTGLGHGARSRVSPDNESCLFAGTLRDGSDGTRTRDLRRDRPNQAPRRLVTYSSERRPLQVFFRTSQPGAAWLSQSSNRRLGHEWATKSCRRRQRGAGPRSDRDPLAERRQHRSEIALPGQDRSQPPGRAELEGQSSLTRPRFLPREVPKPKFPHQAEGGHSPWCFRRARLSQSRNQRSEREQVCVGDRLTCGEAATAVGVALPSTAATPPGETTPTE
jgi:hypothetical protein